MAGPTPASLAKNGTEDCHQAALFCWCSLPEQQTKYPEFERMLFAIPNGGERNIIVAAKLKATGTKAGTLDIFLSVARGGCHGLYIELKKIGGPTMKSQHLFIADAHRQGYGAALCYGWEAARDVLIEYMAS